VEWLDKEGRGLESSGYAVVTVLVALALIYSRPLANFLDRLAGEKR
jgi:hypothetical protein